MIGSILIQLAFLLCLLSVSTFYIYHRRGVAAMLQYGRTFYQATTVVILLASGYLLYLILTHQFQFTYIWSYSSRDLSVPLLISTFYAGQEGSFMLWLLYTTLIGVFLMRYLRRGEYQAPVMSVYGLIMLALLGMLLVKSPFEYVWESWPDQVKAGFVPPDGRGLNPLLQNYWMVIHPQVLFTGFAAMGVPYAFAVASMMKRDYHYWIKPATPWILYGAAVLGAGIMLGGFWAYETLGWGGYWGWDPVENSSLVPWLISIASIHTLLSQRKNGSFVRTNIALAMLCFIAVLYSTFLTRSGVLGDTSVHSFVAPGMWVYWMLVGVIALFLIIGFGLLMSRLRDMPKLTPHHSYLSREFALFLGSASLVSAAVFVTVGTSSPIITQILQGRTTAVDISYYVTTSIPLGIAIGILSGLGQLLWWTRSDSKNTLKVLRVPVGISLILTAGLILMGLEGILVILFVLGAIFSLSVNLQVGWQIIKANPKYAGGAVAHVGLGLMFLGFVSSGNYNDKETLSLPQGRPVESLGYTLTYTGYKPFEKEKFAFEVNVEKEGRKFTLAPIMYFSSYTNGLMRNPDIRNLYSSDFYIAPLNLQEKGADSEATKVISLKKGESQSVNDIQVTFNTFVLPSLHQSPSGDQPMNEVGARLEVSGFGATEVLTPLFGVTQGAVKSRPLDFHGRYAIELIGVNVDSNDPANSTIEIRVTNTELSSTGSDVDVLVVEASLKPYINLVWAGVILMMVGLVISIVRRAREARQPPTSE